MTEIVSTKVTDSRTNLLTREEMYRYVGSLIPSSISSSIKPVYHIEHQETSGTNGGQATAGSWETRTLNTEVINEITGASLSSNVITLPAGDYRAEIAATGYFCNRHQSRLRDTTAGSNVAIGLNCISDRTVGGHGSNVSVGRGEFTLSVSSTLELQTQVQNTRSTDGWGQAASFGTEVYAFVKIEKMD